MINLLLGPPGGGKSYEATVFHILPALQKGRKVITNLPLDLDRLAHIDPNFPELVQKVENRTGVIKRPATRFSPASEEQGVIRAFSTMDDYADPWRHPENGSGPLYVIDECHLALPRGNTLIAVEEWYSLHRHESADVLLITQSYGKVSKSIIDLVQVCYRVKKATTFGSEKKYIRKVQDGVRGEVVNTSIREYQKRYFGLYKSHTRGGGSELAATDIVPFWRRWPFIGLAICIMIFMGMMASGISLNPLKQAKPKEAKAVEPGPAPVKVVTETVIDGKLVSRTIDGETTTPAPAQTPTEGKGTPFEGHNLHIIGSIIRKGSQRVLFAVSTGDRYKMQVTSDELESLGYKISYASGCAVELRYGDWRKWAICDAPVPEMLPGGAMDLPDDQRRGGRTREAGGPAPSAESASFTG